MNILNPLIVEFNMQLDNSSQKNNSDELDESNLTQIAN